MKPAKATATAIKTQNLTRCFIVSLRGESLCILAPAHSYDECGIQLPAGQMRTKPPAGSEQRLTGVKGYVDEPFTQAIVFPSVLFDRYTRDRNLAESVYAASALMG